MRTVPYLRFYLDEDLKKELEVLELLRKVEAERAAAEGAQPKNDEGNATDGKVNL